MKNIIIVTGGAGFIGSNLIKSLLKKTSKIIISLDNYSSGNKQNHIKDRRVKYIKEETINISKNLDSVKNWLHHFVKRRLSTELIKSITHHNFYIENFKAQFNV